MQIYQTAKNKIITEKLHDNSKGSALLFDARSGCLRARCHRIKLADYENTCIACGDSAETIGHILLVSQYIYPQVSEDIVTLPEAIVKDISIGGAKAVNIKNRY